MELWYTAAHVALCLQPLKKKRKFSDFAHASHINTQLGKVDAVALIVLNKLKKKNRHTEHKKHHLIHIGVTKNKHLYQVQASV